MIYLTNSNILPNGGTYETRELTRMEFVEEVKKNLKEINNRIGYSQNLTLLREWTGISFEVSRLPFSLEIGDRMLVMKLKYRPLDPYSKGEIVGSEEFVFFETKRNK